MKKTLTLLLAAIAVFSMNAANFFTAPEQDMGTPVKMENVKQAPAGLQALMVERWASKLKATPNLPGTTVDDLVGGYDWVYRQYTGGFTTQPDTISNNYTFQRDTEDNVDLVAINKIDDSNIRITGMFMFPAQAEMGTTSGYTTFTIDDTQTVYYNSTYGACKLQAAWYYEGDDTYDAGWYVGDIVGFILEDGIIFDTDINFYYLITSGTYANRRLGWIWEPGSYMLPDTDYNGLMTFNYTSSAASNAGLTPTYDYPVILTEDDNYVVTVENFAGVATNPVTINLEEGRTWTADNDIVLYSNNTYNYVLYGLDGNSAITLIGTGTEKVLTFGSEWTGWDRDAGYWIGRRSATTITLISDDEFVYPGEEVPEPVITIDTEFGTYDAIQTVHVTVENMPEGGSIKYQLIPSNTKDEWTEYNDETGIVVEESAALTVAVFDANNEILAEVSGEYTIDLPTGIETIAVNNNSNEWYNIAGQKLNGKPSAAGIYINGGRKVIIK